MNNKAYALITGASSGLGLEFSRECAKRGMNLILVALADENLFSVGESISKEYTVDVVCKECDLSLSDNVYRLSKELKGNYCIDLLINNAGMGCSRPFEKTSDEFINSIIQVNVTALSLLTRLMIPELRKNKQAYVLNIASMASFSPMAFKAVYPASKAFVYSFSRGLYEEYRKTNLFVSVLHPGPMMTNEDVSQRIRKQGKLGRIGLISPQKMAHLAINGVLKRKSILIPGFMNKLNWFMMKLIPVELQLHLLSRVVRREFDDKSSAHSYKNLI